MRMSVLSGLPFLCGLLPLSIAATGFIAFNSSWCSAICCLMLTLRSSFAEKRRLSILRSSLASASCFAYRCSVFRNPSGTYFKNSPSAGLIFANKSRKLMVEMRTARAGVSVETFSVAKTASFTLCRATAT